MNYENFTPQKPESKSRKFWRVVFGSMLGFLISNVILVLLSFFMMISILSAALSTTMPTQIRPNSVLKLTLTGSIEERAEENPFENTPFESYSDNATGLDDILNSLEAAATDPNIKGISLEFSSVSASPATLTEIRNALNNFKTSGKFIYAYSEVFSQSGYYLASVADKVFISNLGNVDIKGIALQLMFYKGLIEKLDVTMQIVRHGTFKSAVEPFILDKMSAANREQLMLLANDIWNVMAQDIALCRNISVEDLNQIADQLMCVDASTTLAHKLVDSVMYPIDYQNFIRSKLGISEDKKINYASLSDYKKQVNKVAKGDNIAIIYAFGSIYDGKGDNRNIYSENLCKEIRKAYQDENVKAIVLRVNSGGGSARASEMIWNEMELAKAAGKKVVTSMGDYAASGGYYIACNSDCIVAQPNTLTGSIGVFGMIPTFQKTLKNKLGITIDVAKTHEHADFMTALRPMDELEIKKLTLQIESIYEVFTNRVANGRNMKIEEVYKVAEGRIWSGVQAKNLGLIDELGSIDVAIKKAAELAELTDYGIVEFPKKQDFITRLFSSFDSETRIEKAIQQQLGEMYYTYKGVKTLTESSGIQAKLPFEISLQD